MGYVGNFSYLSFTEPGKYNYNTIAAFYERSEIMLSDMMDYKNSISKKILKQDKVDPGTFSFLEPGWWALHAATITAVFILGATMAKKSRQM
jgi:hypothetical protein